MIVCRDPDRVGVRRRYYAPCIGWLPNGTILSMAPWFPAHGVIPDVWAGDRLLPTPIVDLEKRTRHVPWLPVAEMIAEMAAVVRLG